MENLLEIKSLNTYYGESHILRDVDLNVKSGEMVCLIGRNGCLLYTSPSPRDSGKSRMPSSA